MPECYIRGSTIKYLRIPDEVIDMVKEEVVAKGRGRGDNKGPRGGQRGGRGGVFQRGGKIPTNLFTKQYSDTYCVFQASTKEVDPEAEEDQTGEDLVHSANNKVHNKQSVSSFNSWPALMNLTSVTLRV
jgi:hypothetical protein